MEVEVLKAEVEQANKNKDITCVSLCLVNVMIESLKLKKKWKKLISFGNQKVELETLFSINKEIRYTSTHNCLEMVFQPFHFCTWRSHINVFYGKDFLRCKKL